MLLKSQTNVILDYTFKIDDYIKFSNPVPYVMTPDSSESFLVMYSVFIGMFYAIFCLVSSFANYFYKYQQKSAS